MNNYQIPCVVGITGHRDLVPEQIPEIKSLVRDIIVSQLEQYPNTPVVVMSPLAEGADTVVAQVALDLREMPEYQDRVALYAPLPLELDLYRQDFQGQALDELNRLIDCSDECFTIEPHLDWSGADASKLSLDVDPNYSTERNVQYSQIGTFVARHSNILVALWDGTDNFKVGGTAQIVKYMRNQPMIMCEHDECQHRASEDGSDIGKCDDLPVIRMPGYLSQAQGIAFEETGELKHIRVDRLSNNNSSLNTVSLIRDERLEDGKKYSPETLEILKEMEDHNLFVSEKMSSIDFKEKLMNGRAYFYCYEGRVDRETAINISDLISPSREFFTFLDEAAKDQQSLYQRGLLFNVIIVILALFFNTARDKLADSGVFGWASDYLLMFYFGFFMVLVVQNTYLTLKKYKNRFLRSRLCAENVRINTGLLASNINDSLLTSLYSDRPFFIYVNLWNKVLVDVGRQSVGQVIKPEIVQEFWIQNQISFTKGNTMKDRRFKEKRLNKLYSVFLTVSFVLLMANLTLNNNIFREYFPVFMQESSVLITIMMVGTASLALLFNRLLSVFNYKGDLEQNKKLRHYFESVDKRISENISKHRIIKESLIEIAHMVLNIQYAWYSNHKSVSINELGRLSKVSNVAWMFVILSILFALFSLVAHNISTYLIITSSIFLIASIYLFKQEDHPVLKKLKLVK